MICGVGLPASTAARIISSATLERSDRAEIAIPDAPALAYDIAIALPKPLDAPVIRIYLPVKLAWVGSMYVYVSVC